MSNKYTLPEKDGHVVSYSVHGNKNGPSILSFHGGPGSKSKEKHAQIFDLEKYQVILFDQRGCGESAPLGGIEKNTTIDTLNDADQIREELGIDTWYISGSSWGSTLALLYALEYSEYIRGLLLSAIWLGDKESGDWSFHGTTGVAQLMPDVLERREAFLKKYNTTPKDAAGAFSQLLENSKETEQKDIVAGVLNWESNLFSPTLEISYVTPENVSKEDIASVTVFLHYEKNGWFLEDNQIMNAVSSIKEIPTIIVHGRYDVLCPMVHAYRLKCALKDAKLVIASSSGHALTVEGHEIRRLAFDQFLDNQEPE